jgi:indolepyruvate ferredoxin oxidoreductase beta subunit
MIKQPYKIAILAMGGEGGGVLADWIVQLGEANGFIAQTTSVPGVAQRTGATIYYVELFEKQSPAIKVNGKEMLPVLSLMPMPGDVDIVLASELMEAGRAIVRGLVSSNRTTLITSTHRVYAMSEKSHLGDGRVDAAKLLEESSKFAKRFIGFDMAKLAQDSQSVISAVLFGALASSKTLPFTKEQFEDTIRNGGVGVKQSLLAFSNAFEMTQNPLSQSQDKVVKESVSSLHLTVQADLHPKIKSLIERIDQSFPIDCQEILMHGVRRLVDYQDPEYAHLYLDRLHGLKVDFTDGSNEVELIRETARHLALWMYKL